MTLRGTPPEPGSRQAKLLALRLSGAQQQMRDTIEAFARQQKQIRESLGIGPTLPDLLVGYVEARARGVAKKSKGVKHVRINPRQVERINIVRRGGQP